ncbi:MAG: hypothetical protein IPM35_02615 [Myxococcales bacterium]|nr:hypothetical protein [Myxococcales bacterium]
MIDARFAPELVAMRLPPSLRYRLLAAHVKNRSDLRVFIGAPPRVLAARGFTTDEIAVLKRAAEREQ